MFHTEVSNNFSAPSVYIRPTHTRIVKLQLNPCQDHSLICINDSALFKCHFGDVLLDGRPYHVISHSKIMKDNGYNYLHHKYL